MGHGLFDIFAFQESVVLQTIFMIVILAMLWVGFRRWLQYKEKMAEETAKRADRYGAQMERVEARLKALEQIVTDVQTATQIEALRAKPLLKSDEI